MANKPDRPPPKPLEWVASSKSDLDAFPGPVRRECGYALYLAQIGTRSMKAKPMRGFGGADVLEIIAENAGNTYRAVYTVRFAKTIYVLHAFQKKSKKGIGTPKSDIELIKQRFKAAAEHYERQYGTYKS